MSETAEMGRVLVTAKIDNLGDLYEVERGRITADEVRSITVENALVDTGASNLSLPKSMIEHLGLMPLLDRPMRTANGIRVFKIFGAVRVHIQGRDCTIDVTEVDDDCPVLVGQVALELMDWVIDMKSHRLIGNPDHGGKWMQELY